MKIVIMIQANEEIQQFHNKKCQTTQLSLNGHILSPELKSIIPASLKQRYPDRLLKKNKYQ